MILGFIEQHKILDIGVALPDELFAEVILDSPHEFVDIVMESDYFISNINWYERAKIDLGSTMGFGGPLDPRAPEEYFFSEVPISREFSISTTKDEYIGYLNSIQTEYWEIGLIPSFGCQRKITQKTGKKTGDGFA